MLNGRILTGIKRRVLSLGKSTVHFFLLSLLVGLLGGDRGVGVSLTFAQESVVSPAMNLHGVSFLTTEEGWVVGQLGAILHTGDGGKSWKPQSSGTNLLLTAVDFVDRSYGWVAGEEGILLHSADGGRTWQRQQSGVLYALFDVEFIDQDRGWAVGDWGTILSTQDGGRRWVERSLGIERSLSLDHTERGLIEPAVLHDVIAPRTGEVIAKAGQPLTTELIAEITRQGINSVRVREDVVLNAVFFLDERRGWICGERGLVLRTTDGGESWERAVLLRPSTQRQETTEEEMSEEELAAFGMAAPPPSLYGVFFISPLQGWVVGQEGLVAWTQDGGGRWEFQQSPTQEALYDVGVIGEVGWIAGNKGTVLVSTNGGQQWERRELGLQHSLSWLRRLAVVPGDHAFLVGANGLILASGKTPTREIWVQKPAEKE